MILDYCRRKDYRSEERTKYISVFTCLESGLIASLLLIGNVLLSRFMGGEKNSLHYSEHEHERR